MPDVSMLHIHMILPKYKFFIKKKEQLFLFVGSSSILAMIFFIFLICLFKQINRCLLPTLFFVLLFVFFPGYMHVSSFANLKSLSRHARSCTGSTILRLHFGKIRRVNWSGSYKFDPQTVRG